MMHCNKAASYAAAHSAQRKFQLRTPRYGGNSPVDTPPTFASVAARFPREPPEFNELKHSKQTAAVFTQSLAHPAFFLTQQNYVQSIEIHQIRLHLGQQKG
jgi:hypothetical protein